jgi:demethylmenaquinone methyltransferase/2-methoxy-6-polyprenyl-1,4-benzoquinol methylase
MNTATPQPLVVRPYAQSADGKKQQVARMFNSIAHRYDLLNHSLSLGTDIIWRKKAVACLRPLAPKQILDVATGTGDLALEALSLNPDKVIGVDISEGMLELGRKKVTARGLDARVQLLSGDSEALPFADGAFDAVTVAFGVRNFEDLHRGLCEMRRVLRPGGMMVVLEFSRPTAFPIKQLYWFYFDRLLPLFGKMVSKDDSAYAYLPESVRNFPDGEAFKNEMLKAGFARCSARQLTFGIATIYTGTAD